jgi:hypothetical protein
LLFRPARQASAERFLLLFDKKPREVPLFRIARKIENCRKKESAIHGGQLFFGILPQRCARWICGNRPWRAGPRLKGVDKSVDGQKDARPPTCPPPAAFPHTHRRSHRVGKNSKIKSKSEESNIPV